MFLFRQGWSKPGQGCRVGPCLFFLHYSPNWFIFTAHDTWCIMVALCLVSCEGRYLMLQRIRSMCHGSPVKIEIFILFNSHSLFNDPLTACLDWTRATACRALRHLKPQHQRFFCTVRKDCGRLYLKALMIWYFDPLQKYPNWVVLSALQAKPANDYRCVLSAYSFISTVCWKRLSVFFTYGVKKCKIISLHWYIYVVLQNRKRTGFFRVND